MATDLVVPRLGESITEAVVAKWLKDDGEPVAVDEPVADIETDKVSISLPAPAADADADRPLPPSMRRARREHAAEPGPAEARADQDGAAARRAPPSGVEQPIAARETAPVAPAPVAAPALVAAPARAEPAPAPA